MTGAGSPWLIIAAILFAAAAACFKVADEKVGGHLYFRAGSEGSAIAAAICFVGHIMRVMSQ